MHVTTPAYVDLIPSASSGYIRFFTKEQKEFYLGTLEEAKIINLKNR